MQTSVIPAKAPEKHKNNTQTTSLGRKHFHMHAFVYIVTSLSYTTENTLFQLKPWLPEWQLLSTEAGNL